ALALAHARLLRLLGDRLVGEHAHPDLAAALDEARHRHARRLDLPVGQPARLERLQPVVAERHVRPPPGLARHPAALLLPVLHFLRHQHTVSSPSNPNFTTPNSQLTPKHKFPTPLRLVFGSCGVVELSASSRASPARSPVILFTSDARSQAF